MHYILLLLGFFLLIKGADYFLDGSSNISRILKIPPLIIGITIIAFGTSTPEAAVSITASLNNQNDLAMATIIGSNIFNLLMVIGAAGFIRTLYVEKSSSYKEFAFLIFISISLIILSSDILFKNESINILSRLDGMILLILFIIFVYNLISSTLKYRNISLEETSISIDNDCISFINTQSLSKSIFCSICGMISIVIGGKLVVNCCSYIALTFGISNQLIGLTIVSIGTSLPEFITCIIATTKGESDIALGSIIGSNIFNILFILGISSFISPITIQPKLIINVILMILFTILTYLFVLRKKDVNKFESLILIGLYLTYTTYLITTS